MYAFLRFIMIGQDESWMVKQPLFVQSGGGQLNVMIYKKISYVRTTDNELQRDD